MAEKAVMCPDCKSTDFTSGPDYISCKACGLHGNPTVMKWCLKVPMFNPVDPSMVKGDLYKNGDVYWQMMGYAPGCGREVKGDFCTSCRSFLPQRVDHVDRKSRARPARADID